MKAAAQIMERLYNVFTHNGCSLAEINPLVTTPDGKVLALDAKIIIDDNELYWRPDLEELRDEIGGAASRGRSAPRQPLVHQARWQRRLRRERRRARHGDDGPGEVLRRRAGQLPRHRRQLESREGGERAQDHHHRPEREGDPLQHLRRHHPHRRRGQRHQDRARAVPGQGADRGAPHRHQRGGGLQDPQGHRHDGAQRHGRGGAAGGQAPRREAA